MEENEKKTYYTEARAKNNAKYLKSLDEIKLRTPSGTKEEYKNAATAAGKSLNQYIVDCVNDDIKSSEGKEIYTHEMAALLGEVYNGILKVMNKKGHDPYWTISDKYPFKCLIMLLPRAISLKIPPELDVKIEKLMDMVDVKDMDKLMRAPMPMEYSMDFQKGMLKSNTNKKG